MRTQRTARGRSSRRTTPVVRVARRHAVGGAATVAGRATYLDAGGRAPVHPVAREAYRGRARRGLGRPATAARARAGGPGCCSTARARPSPRPSAPAPRRSTSPRGTPRACTRAVRPWRRARRRVGARIVVVGRGARRRPRGGRRHASADVVRVVPVDRVGPGRPRRAGRPPIARPASRSRRSSTPTARSARSSRSPRRSGPPPRAGVPLLVDAGASVGPRRRRAGRGTCSPRTPATGAGRPASASSPSAPASARRRPGRRTRTRWFPGGVSVPAAVAAAASLRAVLAERAARRPALPRLVDLIRERVAATVPGRRGRRRPDDRLPHVVTFSCLYVDGEALRHRARPARVRRRLRVGVHVEHARAQPRARRDGRAHPRQRADRPAPRASRADDVDRFCAVLPDGGGAGPADGGGRRGCERRGTGRRRRRARRCAARSPSIRGCAAGAAAGRASAPGTVLTVLVDRPGRPARHPGLGSDARSHGARHRAAPRRRRPRHAACASTQPAA